MPLLDDLNPRQREAVLATDGPVLVLAGAGTGKTRVITYRVAHLVSQGVPGRSILAVTFTNKAADEMKERIAKLLAVSGEDAGEVWTSTFHSFSSRLLRRESARAGLPRDFPIYDDEDQLTVVKQVFRELGLGERAVTPRGLLERISAAKNRSVTPEQMEAEAADPAERHVAKVFRRYQESLREAGALDFDDLLLRAVDLLRTDSVVRENWTRRFRYLQVDEYQDSNRPQYELVHLLAGKERNLCVVGDEDQAIYTWRGADVGNILRFSEDFPQAKVIRLEENYRSTQAILDAAGAVVAHNRQRLGKTLLATRRGGDRLRFFEALDAEGEAAFVAEEVSRRLREDAGTRVAVLYRINSQSRAFEEALRRKGLRYRVLGGFSFYQRAEVKDALAYVRVVLHPEDEVALLRVLNSPPRGIGDATVAALREHARSRGISLWDAIGAATSGELSLGQRAAGPLREFHALIAGLRQESEVAAPAELLRHVLERTGYFDRVLQLDNAEKSSRAENLTELLNAVADGTDRGESLVEFLDRAALISAADDFDPRAAVTLSSLHSVKGLEFDHAFLAGMEEGLFPLRRAARSDAELEEERRLCYVGMTRAKHSLTLTRAERRRVFGEERLGGSSPSRFLAEIPGELIETAEGSFVEAGETRRYEADPDFVDPYAVRTPRRASGIGNGVGRTRPGSRSGGDGLLGSRVRHPTYGLGTIVGVEGEGDDRKLTVSFRDFGTKKLIERYAHLEWA